MRKTKSEIAAKSLLLMLTHTLIWNLPDTGILKEQPGQHTTSGIPGRGRTFPHSGQKFGPPPKHDISVSCRVLLLYILIPLITVK